MEASTQFLPLLIILAACVVGIYSIRNVPIKDNQFYYAGFWMRLFAGIIDSVIVGIITIIPAIGLRYLVGSSMAGSASMYEIEAVAQGLGNLLGIFVGWIYFATMESSNYQATMGKNLLGLQVVGTDGDQISFGKASGRHFGKIISLLILGIGYFMIGWTKQKQGLHDKMAGCLVVRVNGPSQQFIDRTNSNALPKVERNIAAQAVDKNVDFEVEAMRRYKAGDISEQTFLEIMKPK